MFMFKVLEQLKCFKKGLKFYLLNFIFLSLINVLYCIFSYLFDEGIIIQFYHLGLDFVQYAKNIYVKNPALYNSFTTCQIRYVRVRYIHCTYSSRRLLAESKTCTLGGVSLKVEKYIKRFFFLDRLRECFQWFPESNM